MKNVRKKLKTNDAGETIFIIYDAIVIFQLLD